MEKIFNVNDFIFTLGSDNTYEMTKYIGQDRVIYIPNTLLGFTIERIHENCFKDNIYIKQLFLNDLISELPINAFKGTKDLTVYSPLLEIDYDLGNNEGVEVRLGLDDVVCEDGVVYALFSDQTATVVTNSLSDKRFQRFGRFGLTVEIPEHIDKYEVTEISQYCFKNVANVKYYILPITLKKIKSFAFASNEMLTSLILPNNLMELGRGALADCFNLRVLEINKNIQKIGDYSLFQCYKAMVLVDEGIDEKLLENDFNPDHCLVVMHYDKSIIHNDIQYALTSDYKAYVIGQTIRLIRDVVIPDTVSDNHKTYDVIAIAKMVFKDSKYIRDVKLGKYITHIDDMCFEGSDLTSIELPENLTYLGEAIFKDCLYLKSIKIPQKITRIPKQALMNCQSLVDVELHEYIEIFDEMCFYEANHLSYIDFPINLRELKDYCLYGTNLSYIEIGYGIKEIGELALDSIDLKTLIILNENVSITTDDIISDQPNLTIYLAGDETSDIAQLLEKGIMKYNIKRNAHSVSEHEGVKYLFTELESAYVIGYTRDIPKKVRILPEMKVVKITGILDYAFYNAPIEELNVSEPIITLGKGFIQNSKVKKLTIPIHLKPKIDYLSNVEVEVYDESDNRDICELSKEIESFINKKKYMNPQEIKERFELTNHQFNQIRDKLKEKKNDN